MQRYLTADEIVAKARDDDCLSHTGIVQVTQLPRQNTPFPNRQEAFRCVLGQWQQPTALSGAQNDRGVVVFAGHGTLLASHALYTRAVETPKAL
jgi:hypothetical protein